jgi:hypothetical protein
MVFVLCNLHCEISLNDPNLDVIIDMADYTWFVITWQITHDFVVHTYLSVFLLCWC